jgi:hypothetical protein
MFMKIFEMAQTGNYLSAHYLENRKVNCGMSPQQDIFTAMRNESSTATQRT